MAPKLSDEELARMRERKPGKCAHCGSMVSQKYCRRCNEFFTEVHSINCPALALNDHEGHPTY